jgi:flagellar biosynthesis protein FlhF
MREAIRMVREEQGPDAVILSNRRIGAEIEVVAAVDYDASLIQQATRMEARQQAEQEAAPTMESVSAQAVVMENTSQAVIEAKTTTPAHMTQMRDELNSMRRLMERQLAGAIWTDMKLRQPERVAALHALSDLGIDPDLARQIASELPEDIAGDRARFLPMGLLSRRIPVVKEDLVLKGGVIALIGPTGVGKTTTLAKLAAHFSANYGTRDIALVTTDHYRIGAQEQLFTYGRLLGIPVHTASNAGELTELMKRLSDRKLVLIDTAGMSPRDSKLAMQFSELQGIPTPIKTLLVMAANSQAGTLHEVVTRFGATPLAGCILTKLDESTRIGGAISVAIRRALPLTYVTDGQRVPEDIQQARADRIVIRAMQLARQTPAEIEDDTLAMKFTGATHAHG